MPAVIARIVFSGAVAALLVASPAARALARDPIDEADMAEMREHKPHAAELVERGEALAAAGKIAEAELLFKQAEGEYQDTGLQWRRDCEALTVLGKRKEAIDACVRAMENRRTNVSRLALVRSLLDGPEGPTTVEMLQALAIASHARQQKAEVTYAAISCDIAGRIGDGLMLQGCAEELERIAPNDPATRTARALLQSRCPPLRFWGGWLAIAAAIAITIADALRRRAARIPVGAALAVAAVLCLAPRAALADDRPGPKSGWLTSLPIDDEHPEDHIPSEAQRNQDPLQFGYWLQDLELKARRAIHNGDHAAAARYYLAVSRAVPDRAVGFTLLCTEYEALGDRDKAVGACGDALLREGTLLGDYTHFVNLLLAKPGPLSDKETLALQNVFAHMKEDPAAHDVLDDTECEIGVRIANLAMLRECTAHFAAAAPDDAKTITYMWAFAVQNGDFSLAHKLVERAGTLGVPSSNVAEMQRATSTNEKRHWLRVAGVMAGIVFLFGGGVLAYRFLARRRLTPNVA
jgi:tetratricopeptide (TPR) repeat protein